MSRLDAVLKLADDFEKAVNTLRSGELPPQSDSTFDLPLEERNSRTHLPNVKYIVRGLNSISFDSNELSKMLAGIKSEDDFFHHAYDIQDRFKNLGEELFTVRNIFNQIID